MRRRRVALTLVVTLALVSCASLGLENVIQPPRFAEVDGRSAQLRLLLPSAERPAGGAAVRLWTRVTNPNAISLTLTQLTGDLFIGEAGAVQVDFPVGLPLLAEQDSIVPLDVSLGFDDLPQLGEAALAALRSGTMDYRLEALIGVDAGMLGQPTFGPNIILQGTLRVIR
jgi:hypothetical protein